MELAAVTKGLTVLAEIDVLLPKLLMAEMTLTKARAQIGILLNEVRDKQYWKEKGFENFDGYVRSLEEQFNRGRTTLYAFAGLAKDLLPEVGEEKLTAMGFEKAKLLRQVKKSTGQLPSSEIIDMAADDDVTTNQFRQVLLDNKKLPDAPQDGKYYSLEYFADKQRQETIEAGILSVKRSENLTGQHEMVVGNILEILAQEYLGAHGSGL
jgi:hypothetical protein